MALENLIISQPDYLTIQNQNTSIPYLDPHYIRNIFSRFVSSSLVNSRLFLHDSQDSHNHHLFQPSTGDIVT